MFKIKKQIRILYLSSALWNLSITGAWVAILAARGFSLVQIGLAETVFHITSLIFEIPSGVLADVIGRKKMLILSNLSIIIANLVMVMSTGFTGVCISFVFNALGWNLASGSGDALAYDSMKLAGVEKKYEKYSSDQTIIYRITTAVSTLCAGIALLLGYRIAYLISVINHLIALFFTFALVEVEHADEEENPGPKEQMTMKTVLRKMLACFRESLRFFQCNRRAGIMMFSNSVVGAFDILLLFFLQSKLREASLPDMWLGVALFVMEVGGIVGARVILKAKKVRYVTVFAVCALVVLSGIMLEHTGLIPFMVAGGFLSAAADDALQVRTDARLQDSFSSAQRATLISIASFTFSVVMIVLSPLAGWFFTFW